VPEGQLTTLKEKQRERDDLIDALGGFAHRSMELRKAIPQISEGHPARVEMEDELQVLVAARGAGELRIAVLSGEIKRMEPGEQAHASAPERGSSPAEANSTQAPARSWMFEERSGSPVRTGRPEQPEELDEPHR
jgi:hypothetical protein